MWAGHWSGVLTVSSSDKKLSQLVIFVYLPLGGVGGGGKDPQLKVDTPFSNSEYFFIFLMFLKGKIGLCAYLHPPNICPPPTPFAQFKLVEITLIPVGLYLSEL